MLNQSFRQVFVTNTSVLLPSGSTADLAVGQIGITDANNYAVTTSPTYGTNKAIIVWQGMPDVSHLPLMAGIPQTNQSSKLIKGKLLKKFRRKSAHLGQNQKVAIGFDGVDVTKTLDAKCGEVRTVYIKLTGNPIDKLYSNEGFIRQYRLDTGCCDDCGEDSCADVAPLALAEALVEKINNDPKWSAGTGQLIRAKTIVSEALDTSDAISYTIFTISIADAGDNQSLANVQVQYPGYGVIRTERTGIISTYQIIQPTAATAITPFTNAGIYVVNPCGGACPAGYTLSAQGYMYRIVRTDAGTAGALTTLRTNYSLAAAGETSVRLTFNAPNQISTYLIVSNTANQAAVGTDTIEFLRTVESVCTLTTPTTTAWVAGDVLFAFPKVYHITLEDTVCGTSRLTELQDAYPDLVVTQLPDGPSDCIHAYETTIYSDPITIDCEVEEINYPDLPAFEAIPWEPVAATPDTTIQAGVIVETAFVNRITGECTFDYYPYEADTVHIQMSEYNADYNASPCESRWPVTELQSVKYPVGVGAYVREAERKSLAYFLKEHSMDPAVREAEGYSLQTDPFAFYDEYTLEFDFSYKVLGWSQTYIDSYHLVVYVPQGDGVAFENAILTYISSVGNDVDIELN